MTLKKMRAAVVGASTMLGRELAEKLAEAESSWSLTLLDDETAAGQMTAAGDEAVVIQALTPGSLSDLDIVFFASDASTAKTHWPEVKRSGALVVDLSGGLVGEPGFVTTSPWIEGGGGAKLDLSTAGIVTAHPAALFLAVVAMQLGKEFGPVKLVATVLQPASQYGKSALDELQAQTASLLTFQSMPREVFDAATAFNLIDEFGPDAKYDLAADAERVRRDFAALAGESVLELQLIQAPVFHSFAASAYVEFSATATRLDIASITRALGGGVIHVAVESDERPSNQAAARQERILVAIQPSRGGTGSDGMWLWMSADNLRLTAAHAVQCAMELARLQPAGSVQ